MKIHYPYALIQIPPQEDRFELISECPSECTSKFLPKEGINFVRWFPQMHLLGTQVLFHSHRSL